MDRESATELSLRPQFTLNGSRLWWQTQRFLAGSPDFAEYRSVDDPDPEPVFCFFRAGAVFCSARLFSRALGPPKFNRMRILFSSYAFRPGVGGIETVSEILAEEFVAAGHEVELITEMAGENSR